MSGLSTSLPEFTEKLLSAARGAGADAADALASMGSAIEINVRSGVLEQAERSETMDLGLRVLVGQRQAVVSGSDLRDGTLTTMAERAVAMAKEAPDDPHAGLAAPEQLAVDWNIEALELYDTQPEPSA
ncbi:MAG: PmbA/TldA family metallopeptidase, partial [Paracoccaceae bacterium]